MKQLHRIGIAGVCIILGGWCALEALAGDDTTDLSPAKPAAARRAAANDAKSLTESIDRLLASRWAEAKVQSAPPADDAEYLRRVCLDLVGKIPTAAEARLSRRFESRQALAPCGRAA
jgi:Protein of unknown function (DUF1549)